MSVKVKTSKYMSVNILKFTLTIVTLYEGDIKKGNQAANVLVVISSALCVA